MDHIEGELRCRDGDMPLAPNMQSELLDIVAHPPDEPAPRVLGFRYGGKWCCPADGAPMTEESGYMRCSACGRCIPGRLIAQLIEMHPHRTVSG